jgi:hypothetical protein
MQGEEVQSLLPPILVNLDTVILCQLHYGSRPGVHCFNVLLFICLLAGLSFTCSCLRWGLLLLRWGHCLPGRRCARVVLTFLRINNRQLHFSLIEYIN